MPRNPVEILSNTCLYNILETSFSYRGYLLAVNFQSYLGTSSLKRANNVPKLLGINYVAKNWALAMMLKALSLVHLWRVLFLKEKKMTSVRSWSGQRKTDRFLAKFTLKITTKSAFFCLLLFGEVYPENSSEIPAKSADFSANLSLKNPRNLTFSSTTYQKP